MAKRLRALHKRGRLKAKQKEEQKQEKQRLLRLKRGQRKVFEILPNGGLAMAELQEGEYVVEETKNPLQPPTDDNEWLVTRVKENGHGTRTIGASVKQIRQMEQDGELELIELPETELAIESS